MKSQVWMLSLSLLLMCGTIGLGEESVVEEAGSSGEIENSVGMKLKLIPAGEFLMGSSRSPQEIVRMLDVKDYGVKYLASEHPQHKVRLTQSFYLGLTEVTQGQWKSVMGTEPWRGEGA